MCYNRINKALKRETPREGNAVIRRFIKRTANLLIWTEVILHLIVFIMLVLAVLVIIFDSIKTINNGNISILTLVSNALLLLVIKEVMWTVLRFFRREKFSLSPFIYVGVISGIREILFLSIQKSIEKGNELNITLEMLINAFVVFLLVGAYYLFKKARILAGEDS